MHKLTYTSIESQKKIFNKAQDMGLLDEKDTAVIFVDFDLLKNRLQHLTNVFPGFQQHTAIKTNPLFRVLDKLVELGSGLEAASYEEVIHGLQFTDRIIFDSPAKTAWEINHLEQIDQQIIINANSFRELNLLRQSKHRIGLRINPMVDTGSPADLTVSDNRSKFGVPILLKKEIIKAFIEFDNLEGLHMHIGSQIGNYDAWLSAVEIIYQLAQEIDKARESKGRKKLTYIDIGGGFSVDYQGCDTNGLNELGQKLIDRVPNLAKDYQIYTEFGRFVHANASWAVSTVADKLEYTNPQTLVAHLGADMFLRDVYATNKIQHKIDKLEEEDDSVCNYQIAGPLCFGGDFINRNVTLPNVEIGDHLIIQDVGANTFSLWSMHCSRSFPKVIGYSNDGTIEVVKERVTPEDMIQFWG